MTKGETPTTSIGELKSPAERDDSSVVKKAHENGVKQEIGAKSLPGGMSAVDYAEMRRLIHLIELKNELAKKFTDPRAEAKAKKMGVMKESARQQKEFLQKYGLTFSEAAAIIREQDKQKQQKRELATKARKEQAKITQIHKAIQDMDIIQGEFVNDTPPPLPGKKIDTSIPPVDISAAKLAAQVDSKPAPTGLWGKFKSLFTTSRDERASAKFSTMQADSGETSADRRAAKQGEKMMKAAEQPQKINKFEAWSELDATPTADEIKFEHSEAKTERRGQQMMEKAEALSNREFKQSMKMGKHQAEVDKFEEEMASGPLPGKHENANLDKLNRVDDEINSLRGTIESIKFGGWFGSFKTSLKTNRDGHITNLPGGNEDMVIDDLARQKEKLGSKGKIEAANQIVEQMETLTKYTNLLVERDKLMAGNK